MSQPKDYEIKRSKGGKATNTVSFVEHSRLLPWIVVSCILSGVALGLSATTIYVQATSYRTLERENRLLQLKVDEFRMALIKADIDPNPHVPGESQ